MNDQLGLDIFWIEGIFCGVSTTSAAQSNTLDYFDIMGISSFASPSVSTSIEQVYMFIF